MNSVTSNELIMNELRKQLEIIVIHTNSLSLKVKQLRDLRDLGVTQLEAKTHLEELRQDLNEKEDHILELLDFVCGFCSEHFGFCVWFLF